MMAKCAAILLNLILVLDMSSAPDGAINRPPETNPSMFPFLRSVFSTAVGGDNRSPDLWLPDIDFGFRIPPLIQPAEPPSAPQLPQSQQQAPSQPQSNNNFRNQHPTGQQQWQRGSSNQGPSVMTSPPQIRRVIFGRCPDFPCPNGLTCDLKSNSCRYYYDDY